MAQARRFPSLSTGSPLSLDRPQAAKVLRNTYALLSLTMLFAAGTDSATNGGLTNVDFLADLALSNSGGSVFVGYADVVLELSRTAIAPLLNGATISGAEAYRAWFPEDPPNSGAV